VISNTLLVIRIAAMVIFSRYLIVSLPWGEELLVLGVQVVDLLESAET
jgi:hypothetical protein